MQTDLMSEYVRRRLDHWGDEFALHKDCEYLGHASKNLIAVLMEHHEMPGRVTGYKPLEVNAEAQQVELAPRIGGKPRAPRSGRAGPVIGVNDDD